MPFTLNGIGTHYYGRGKASARRGTCEFCGRTATLTSYETRECFCILFIPLIPIAKYRIFDECSSCRKHRRLKAGEFDQQVSAQIAPLRDAIRRSPTDVDARERLIRELASLRMNEEAEAAAREATLTIPTSSGLNLLAGQILAGKGDLEGASPYLERAVNLDASDADSRVSLGRVLYLQGNYAVAARHLEEAHRLAPSNAIATWLLADTYTNMQRWQDALGTWQQIPRPDRNVLRRIGECKQRLGYELHPAEKRAARRWWPFRRRGAGRIKPVRPDTGSSVSGSRVAILVLVVMAVFIVGGVAMAVYNSKHVEVYFDSTMPRPTFVIDGKEFKSDTTLPWRKTLTPGKHTIAVLDMRGTKVEETTIDAPAPDFGDSVFNEHKYVYNARAERIYRRESIEYTINGSDAHYSFELIANQNFFGADNIDYVFRTPPKTIDLPQGSSHETKSSLQIEDGFTLHDFGVYSLNRDKVDDAEAAFKHALQIDACDTDSRSLLSTIRAEKGKPEDGVAVAKEGLTACSGSELESHRVYQDALRRAGRTDEAVAIYRAALAQHPDSATYHYLLGRLVPSSQEEIALEREALRIDPKLARAHAALGYSLIAMGDYDNAMHEIASAIENGLHDNTATLHYVYAAVAASKTADAHALVDASNNHRPTWTPRWLMALAEKKWTSARSLYDERTKRDPKSEQTWLFGQQLFRLQGDSDALGKHMAAASSDQDLAGAAVATNIEMLLEDGKWSEAVTAVDKAGDKLSGLWRDTYEMYAVAALMIQGDTKAAAARMAQARDMIQADESLDDEQRDMLLAELGTLDGSTDPQRAVDALRQDLLQMKHAWFFLGARAKATGDTAHAREYFTRSAQASFDLTFPMLAAQRLAGS